MKRASETFIAFIYIYIYIYMVTDSYEFYELMSLGRMKNVSSDIYIYIYIYIYIRRHVYTSIIIKNTTFSSFVASKNNI